jgi:hypothetical protein
MGLTDKIASALGAKQDEAVEGPSGGPHPAPPEQTVDDPEQDAKD